MDASPQPQPVWLSRSKNVSMETVSSTGSGTNTIVSDAGNNSSSGSGSGSRTDATTTGTTDNSHTSSSTPTISTSVWKPLRKYDCQLLNERYSEFTSTNNIDTSSKNKNKHLVYIDGGRKVLNFNSMTISPTYPSSYHHNMVEEEVCHATWFVRHDYNHASHHKEVTLSSNNNNSSSSNNSNHSSTATPTTTTQLEFKEDGITVWASHVLYPVTDAADVHRIETLYQQLRTVPDDTSETRNSTAAQEIEIDQGSYKVQLQHSNKNDTLSLRKVPNEKGWTLSNLFIKPSYTLQRGYPPYQVVGEAMEIALGPVRHMVFVIHGIGEALFHRTDIQITGMIQQTTQLRMVLQKKQYTKWQKQCQVSIKKNEKPPPPPNRIELIPIEWYHCLHGSNNSNTNNHPNSTNNDENNSTATASADDLMRNLQLVTLNTIPALRTVANDVLLDVLLYCTPAFGSVVLQTVTQQIRQHYHTLTQEVFPDFLPQGGTCSLMGHSLGSVILWDLLAISKQQQQPQHVNDHAADSTSTDHSRVSSDHHLMTAASYGPSVLPPITDTIPFVPEYSILLGSPMGMFLSLRNASRLFHHEPETSSSSSDQYHSVSSFTLPTNHLYNIFHPSDPVAYRIEPLLLLPPQPPNDIPEPVYLTVPGEDVRLHVKALQFTNVVRKSLFSTSNHSDRKAGPTTGSNTGANSWTSLLESAMANVSSSAPPSQQPNDNSVEPKKTSPPQSLRFPLGGTQNPRIDYCLQPMIVDNEYISAVTAHSSYFTNTDVQDFLVGILH